MSKIISEYPSGTYELVQANTRKKSSIMWLYRTDRTTKIKDLVGVITMSDIADFIKRKEKDAETAIVR